MSTRSPAMPLLGPAVLLLAVAFTDMTGPHSEPSVDGIHRIQHIVM